jgi:alpha-glucuronidase
MWRRMRRVRDWYFTCGVFACLLLFTTPTVKAEDGYRLWLRYDQLPSRSLNIYRQHLKSISIQGDSATFDTIRAELNSACSGLLGTPVTVSQDRSDQASVIVGLPKTSSFIRKLGWENELKNLGEEGFRIRTVKIARRSIIIIASNTDIGALYGVFYFLRLLQTEQPIDSLRLDQGLRVQLRILNHWDNIDGTIERGYAGKSLWNWEELPTRVDPRLRDYARANASVGYYEVGYTRARCRLVARRLPPLFSDVCETTAAERRRARSQVTCRVQGKGSAMVKAWIVQTR